MAITDIASLAAQKAKEFVVSKGEGFVESAQSAADTAKSLGITGGWLDNIVNFFKGCWQKFRDICGLQSSEESASAPAPAPTATKPPTPHDTNGPSGAQNLTVKKPPAPAAHR